MTLTAAQEQRLDLSRLPRDLPRRARAAFFAAALVADEHGEVTGGMARLRDGALIAHLGHPDMRVPISWALTWMTM